VLLDADRPWPNSAALLSLVDFPVVSERLAEELGETGRVRDGLRVLRSRGARLAVATLGERGALALSDEGWIESAGFSVAAVDTTGAGDAFRAGFVWALLAGKSAAQVMEVANAAGALNCLAPGAQSGLPSADDVRTLLRDQPREESTAMQNAKATSGSAMVVTLALLLIAGAAGYNYHRNWQAEQVEHGMRPFRAYADQDLRELGAAYRAEVDSRSQSYEALAKRRTKGRATDMLGENIANFEKTQRAADQKRAAAGFMAENQARLREIESELSYRAYTAGGVAVHIKRLTTI
jgi:hypothetical protein